MTEASGETGRDGDFENRLRRDFNDLRREFLDHRSKLVDWWLRVVAIVLTVFVIVASIVGYIGVEQFRELEKEVRESAREAESLTDNIRALERLAREKTTSKFVSDNPEKANEVARSVRENPAATLVERAIANAISLQRSENFEAAIEKWRSIANIVDRTDDELGSRAWFSVGYLHMEESRPYEAIDAYDEAIRLKQDYAAAYNNRGVAKNRLERHEEAIADYDEAIRLKPDYAAAYNNRGGTKNRLERYEEAVADFDQAIRLKPDLIWAYYNRGLANLELGHASRARQDFVTTLALAREKGDEKLASKAEEALGTLRE